MAGFTVSSLTDYVDQSSTELLTAAQFAGGIASMANIQTGCKGTVALQLLAVDGTMLDGGVCSWTGGDGATFSQRNIVTKPIKFEAAYCPDDLKAKWTQILLKAGSKYTEADIPQMIWDEYVKVINKRICVADWQSDISTGGTNLNKYDGLISVITNEAGTIEATPSTWNASNARAIVKDVIANIPAALKGDSEVCLFMGYPEAETYRQALMDANLYHVAAGSDATNLFAEGTNYKIVADHGLDSLARIFALKPSNVTIGVDMESEKDTIEMWVDGSDNKTVKSRVMLQRGVQVAYPTEIVSYHDSTLVS